MKTIKIIGKTLLYVIGALAQYYLVKLSFYLMNLASTIGNIAGLLILVTAITSCFLFLLQLNKHKPTK